ncbi:MAG TPA: DUF2085 domain-containing protein [Thermomicrobiales bacterium]|nr:DUF2085 domain-containing protein [Thermomicrobiales bacterium]
MILRLLPPQLRRFWLWYAIAIGGLAIFILMPGGVAEKSRTLLHGLCAQTPTHSFTFGGQLLPFDARMTGIYGGVLVTMIYLCVRGKVMRWGIPPIRIVVVLSLFVAAMAADGFNSLFTDLGLWHPWTPSNEVRLVTGYLTGIALAVVLSWLLGSAAYRVGNREPGVESFRDLAWVLLPFVPYAIALLSGAAWLYVPLSLLLVASAWLTMSLLALSVLILAFRLDERLTRPDGLHLPGAAAAVIGLAVMLSLALGRVWLESSLGIPSTL